MATAHTNASKGQLAKVVLMPGDPVRANNIANQFLHDVEVVSDVRGIAIYTGYTANNKRISVMASGMGQPSIGIYAYEVYSLGVELIIRVGTAGSFNPDIHVKDVLIAESSHTRSNFAYQLDRKDVFDCDADKEAVEVAKECSKNLVDRHYVVGTIYTNDAFYGETKRMRDNWAKKGYIGVEMESFALYYTAKKLNKKALTLLTVSNHFINNEEDLTQKEKQVSMKNMMTLAIEVAERFAD